MLRTILNQMYQDAFLRDKVPQKRKLKNGLHITLTCHAQGVTLKLARDSVYPSLKEWETVLNNFPYFTGRPGPVPKTIIDSDTRKALVGELPRRTEVARQIVRLSSEQEA